ncbi:MAG: hypothetical protein ABIM43_07300 [candidate division WOR-3 bacterium]
MLKTIRLLSEVLLVTYHSGPELAAKKAKERVGPYIRMYLKGLVFWALIAILSPIPFLILGIIGGWRWLSALSGILWAVWAFFLLVWALPIGVLIEILTGGIKGSGQRYIRWVSGVIVVGLCISLYASIVPIKANLPMFFVLIVGSLILGILNAWIFSRKVITTVVSIIFVLLTLSFFFPMSFETLGEKISEIDVSTAEPERLYITQDSIERGEIKFFRPDGKPRVWYYRTEDGKFELFNRKGSHPIYKKKLKPVTTDIVSQIENQFKAEAERRIQEEQRRREEAERLARREAEQQREAFLNRYLSNRSFVNRPDSQEVAVLVIDEQNRVNLDITQKIASLLKIKRFNITSSLFSGKFVSDGMFERIFNGSAGDVSNLELPKHSDYIILGKKSVNFTENPDLMDVLTAHAAIEIHVIYARTGTVVDSFNVSEVGAGFSKPNAESIAMERIFKKLEERKMDIIRKIEA